MIKVFENQTANDSKDAHLKRGSIDTIFVKGEFDGALVTLEVSPDNGITWFSDSEYNISESCVKNVDVSSSAGLKLRINIENSGQLTNLTVFFG